MTSTRRKAQPGEEWEKKLAALLKELCLPESFCFSGQIHQGGLRSFDVSLKIK